MYLKITNKGTVSRKYYELIGASNKRERFDDPSVIGNKGSGAKLAPIPILRLGLEVAVSSSDALGDYILHYKTEKADLGDREVTQIVFHYEGNGSYPSQLTTDAFRDWDKPIGDDGKKIFKALREYICNAWDEDKGFTLKKVETIGQADPGTTVVFLTLTGEIEQILETLPGYFKILGDIEPLFEKKGGYLSANGKIYPKSEEGVTRLFSQGVLVDCKKSEYYATVFDYSLDDKNLLSEERIIKDFSRYVAGIGELLMDLENPELVLILFGAIMKREAKLELQAVENIKDPPRNAAKAFQTAWEMFFGKKAIIAVNNTQVDEDARFKGYNVVSNVPYGLVTFLRHCGITNSYDVAPRAREKEDDKPDFEVIKLNDDQQTKFNDAYSRFLRYYPEAKQYPVHFFKALDYRLKGSAGHCGEGIRQFKEIWIAECSLDSVKTILKVLVHEGRHCIKKAGDYDRIFTQAADDQIVDLLLANPNPPCKNEWQAKIIPGRGIILPKRFAGQSAHILIHDKEVRIKIGDNTQLSCLLNQEVQGQMSQVRKVSGCGKLSSIFLPESVIRQLPQTVILNIQ